ncbi:uncharacterized protein NECHADRAFT_81177 [Fusarium vanettenii 77-13-4]|uniref:Heterokaryon incompatibility domain-containing protein n=1 Tax=Fusarium vanettenii (strain ATCC MYA-4622 / CBS 123669 / FGSC 9596 / NRRL 45880 / 77-13-4) TaxID=660122 RepID=C7ZHL1_FUSV7|nr:uncharacterized protein NECHADRAFT_81177 [Fusarium vanettenii 77-13-4]EEU36513.1 hypothetical protein NECHADRAFT_81177 [Fusarium vanettenii 77-13-4]
MAQEGQIEKLLRELGLTFGQDAKARDRELLTFDNPHSCEHCRDSVVEVGQEHTVIHCQCGWSGQGPVVSPKYRACGKCGMLHDNQVHREYSSTLQYGLKDAVVAARSGCLLYVFLLDSLGSPKHVLYMLEDDFSWNTIQSLFTMGKFHLSGTINSLDGVPANCYISWGISTASHSFTGGELRMWAMAGDGASKFIDSRPYESNVDSDASWDFARRCLDTCRERHGRCRERLTDGSDIRLRSIGEGLSSEQTDIANIPSRLLDVQAGAGSRIKVIKVDTLSGDEQAVLCSSGFAALSYCWGGPQSLTLTKSQSQHLYGGFSPSELPKTIQDAVRVVQKLGLRYLWVDALCIQQDSDQDKAAEISRMETYYGSATVTICAAASFSAEQGFLFRRKSHQFATGPLKLPLRNKNGTDEGHVYLLKEAKAPPEPITTRGWTMQESLLSRRILIYSERQLYWSCSTSISGCGGELVAMEDRVSGNIQSLVDNIYPIGASLQLPTANQWQQLVMDYTARHIGVPGDKLLAISALVAHLWNISKDRGEKPAYIAGLFVILAKSTSFLEQLRWNAIDPAKSRRASVYRAPSWSWAAIDGPIWNHLHNDRFDFNGDPIMPADRAVIRSYSVDLVHQKLPFGSVRDAHIIIEAKKRRLGECVNIPGLALMIRPGGPNDESWGIRLFPDTEEDAQTMRDIIEKKNNSGGDISLLLLHTSRGLYRSQGLVVSPTASGDMVRIGVFDLHEYALAESDRGSIFKTCVPTSVRLV